MERRREEYTARTNLRMTLDPAVGAGLGRAKRMYLTTFGANGRSGTVPVWFMTRDGALYFTTLRTSLKARRIRATGRVRVALGRTDGPNFEGKAEWVDDRPDLERAVLDAYWGKYPLVVPLFMGWWIRRRLADKRSVLIRITPDADASS